MESSYYQPNKSKLDLSPRNVTLWMGGVNSRQDHQNITPTPFGSERAKEIETQARAKAIHGPWCDQIDKVITPEEKAYVLAVWGTIPSGGSCFMTAFDAIKNSLI